MKCSLHAAGETSGSVSSLQAHVPQARTPSLASRCAQSFGPCQLATGPLAVPSITAYLFEGLVSALYHLLLSLFWNWLAFRQLKMSRTKETNMRKFSILEHTVICNIK